MSASGELLRLLESVLQAMTMALGDVSCGLHAKNRRYMRSDIGYDIVSSSLVNTMVFSCGSDGTKDRILAMCMDMILGRSR